MGIEEVLMEWRFQIHLLHSQKKPLHRVTVFQLGEQKGQHSVSMCVCNNREPIIPVFFLKCKITIIFSAFYIIQSLSPLNSDDTLLFPLLWCLSLPILLLFLFICLYILLLLKKQESSRKTSTALLTMPKPLIVWIKTNCGKFLKRWENQTTLPDT